MSVKELCKKFLRFILKIMYIFPIDRNKIYLFSFDGQAYGYDSRAIVEYLNLNLKNEYKLYWGIKNKKQFRTLDVENVKFVPINRIVSIYHMLTAGTLIYNINPPSYVDFRKEQKLINTWHGYPLKKVGKHVNGCIDRLSVATAFISHSRHYTEIILQDAFEYKGLVLKCGAPRNDIFFKENQHERKEKIIDRLNLKGKKIVLYAPTFRGDFVNGKVEIDYMRLKNALEKKYGGNWVVMNRLHPMIVSKYKIESMDYMDVSYYPDMQDLLLIADILVTDYSSSMWDFALQMKPVILYVSDIDQYENERGLYCSYEELPYLVAKSNDELIELIEQYDEKIYVERLVRYFKEVESYENGNACQTIVNYIRTDEL